MSALVVQTSVNQWGNGLAVRLTKAVAKAVGVEDGSAVQVRVQEGRIVIEPAARKLSLEERLAAFDPKKHGGEVMAFSPVGLEVM